MRAGSTSGRRKKDDGPLATVLPSGALARILAHFFLHPAEPVYFRQLQRITGLPNRSLQVELSRLQQLGVVRRAQKGRSVTYQIRSGHPRWKALRGLVREFAQPADLLRVGLNRIPEVAAAFIYGSFARRSDVHPASDVDVMVLTRSEADSTLRRALAGEALEISGLLGREVNLTRYSLDALPGARSSPAATRMRSPRDRRFLNNVLSGPKQWVVGDESHLRSLIAGRSTP